MLARALAANAVHARRRLQRLLCFKTSSSSPTATVRAIPLEEVMMGTQRLGTEIGERGVTLSGT
jgi:hypothetical protein